MKQFFILVLFFFSGLAIAAEEERQVAGYGQSVKEAITDGLVRAVEQQYGMTIEASTVQKLVAEQTENGVTFSDQAGTESSRKARGNIRSYDLLSKSCDAEGCEVALNVQFTVFKAAGRGTDHLRKIAVMPFSGSNRSFSGKVADNLQEYLTQSRRFAVLDREHSQAYQKEKALWAGDDTPLDEKARIGQVLGLDYMIVGKIVHAGTRRWQETVAMTGESENKAQTSSKVRYQLIEVATRQIKWSGTVSQSLSGNYISLAAKKTAEQISGELLENIYPLRVVGQQDKTVVLNQGGKTLVKGRCFGIYALGEKIFDPYTGNFLGQDEQQVATVKVSSVTAKMSYARLIRGQQSAIENMQIARKTSCPAMKKVKSISTETESRQEIPQAGGIIL
ncbi:hypothetical protein EOPP23_13425 [Endozoicomonas sp. OPT23]|uniref:CsgG/HfaB family protein n=1 Tax=Endozoicomonas sp. OPT23 TaxID=2072845 RepID=UPI00129A2128|nr:CsgG/HfaB family protein [Endozoicomonas sp. OPT23]MRI33991.1 hypothetical protein [Endozoicomonas sp. OPT23]